MVIISKIVKYLLPFVAAVFSFYLFRITNWLEPFDNIYDENIKWAIDLAFNTSLFYIIYDIFQSKLTPNICYEINICDKKGQNEIVLNKQEAENVISVQCKISINNQKIRKEFPNTLLINYPKWITLEIEYDQDVADAIYNDKDKNQISINPNYLVNPNIIDDGTYDLNLKIAPSIISSKSGRLQGRIVNNTIWNKMNTHSNFKDYKISIM
ncbi:hypothetical protein AQ616_09420 [Oceanobacillus sp. E9]|uniref:hypothetical protein n=1 Tax=Oceanobacillus sp. E9 TaxID=1742575 RepID=UPI00084E43B2|nr:hypothetical protein [Oceanobacillus sp. E9]OEH53997.1 hypothetical protein AQ616_09420 [Oceanobacillus sp. E9]